MCNFCTISDNPVRDWLASQVQCQTPMGRGPVFSTKERHDGVQSVHSYDGTQDNSLQGKRILVVDDNQASRELIREALEGEEYVIDEASDGTEALERVRQDSPDLILMDIQMPIMDGYTTLREIRKTDAGLPVIAITAYVHLDNGHRAIAEGFDGYLPKPVNVGNLRAKVAFFLGGEKG